MSDELVQTHSAGCHAFGPRHYECALAEIERLRAEVARLTGCLRAANDQAEEFERKFYLAEQRAEKFMDERDEAKSGLAALHMQYDSLKGVMHDEIAANLAFREAGGALPDEDMPTFCARLLSELNCHRLAAKQRSTPQPPPEAGSVGVPDGGEAPLSRSWRALVNALADDLEAEIENRRAGDLPRRIERDLEVVRTARKRLAAAPAPKETP